MITHGGDRPGERTFVWLRLDPNGYVFASLLSVFESAEEIKSWQLVRMPPGIVVFPIRGGMGFQHNLNSRKALGEFPAFLAKHKGLYDYLYANSLGIYHDVIASPAQMRGEETGPKEIAMGFLSEPKKYTVIMAKEPTGNGWVSVSLVSHAGAARLRAKLSGLKKNSGGIRWKQIDIPYGAMVYTDNKVVFYKIVKLCKPGSSRVGYVFEFRPNGARAYIRFPYVFRSGKKAVEFVERANMFRLKMWVRAGNRE
jgi:hypothetical protein